ncbi:hypothetical protein [Aliamphritea ceti]|uniref:hypothetical protein n=1 Tax=Aliamphritea ceti TaxID=1524258 RepID=UPI0021C3619C|nr:hypothetical protein [Aliamphritea ceti]
MSKIFRLAGISSIAAACLFLLAGCGAHPSSGYWVSEQQSGTDAIYSALELEFDGTGRLHPNKAYSGQESSESFRCLWQAKSEGAVDVQCGNASVDKIRFELIVTEAAEEGGRSEARLMRDGKLVTSFMRRG